MNKRCLGGFSVKIRLFSTAPDSLLNDKGVYWGWSDVLRLVALYLGAQLVMAILLTQILRRHFGLDMAITNFIVYSVALLLVIPLALHHGYWPSKDYLGLKWVDFRRHFVAGAIYGLAYRILPILPVLIVILPFALLGSPPVMPQNNPVLGAELLSATWLLGVIRVVLMAPVTEEYFFRGILYPLLRSRLGLRWAIFVSSALFGAVHGVDLLGFWAFFGGIGLALAYENTGSLATPMIAHSVSNAIGVFFASIALV